MENKSKKMDELERAIKETQASLDVAHARHKALESMQPATVSGAEAHTQAIATIKSRITDFATVISQLKGQLEVETVNFLLTSEEFKSPVMR